MLQAAELQANGVQSVDELAVQCPAPKDKPATCTMHPLQINLGPLLAALGLVAKGTNIYTPLEEIDTFIAAMQDVVKNGLPG